MKQVIFQRADGFYITSRKNYYSYIQNPREIKKLPGVNTWADVYEIIEKGCALCGCNPGNIEFPEY